MAAYEATEREFATARIDLDQSDVASQLQFFYKLFGAILYAACQRQAFGGIKGKTYDVFIETVSSLDIPQDRTFCPFMFPLQYARAVLAGRFDTPVLDDLFKQDLALIKEEVGRPIVIAIDECDLLISSQPLLQKLRNVFMNTAGFMLVMAGTPRLFPAFDEVFSPIIRQFKRIPVKEFQERTKTRQCVLEPLRKIGQTTDRFIDPDTISEIHEVSGGRPYEIQLMCHVLFRRFQSRQAMQMKLSLAALEEVRAELEKSHELGSRPVVTAINRLTRDQLKALRRLTTCDGQATFDQLWALEYSLNGTDEWSRERLLMECEELTAAGILLVSDVGHIRFAGDEFDRLYAKYFGQERKVAIRIAKSRPETLMYVGLIRTLAVVEGLEAVPASIGATEQTLGGIALAMMDAESTNMFDDEFTIARELYWPMVEQSLHPTASAVTVHCFVAGVRTTAFFFGESSVAGTKKVSAQLAEVKARVIELGGGMDVVEDVVPVVPLEKLTQAVLDSTDAAFRSELAEEHASAAVTTYLDDDIEKAFFHFSAAANLGYAPEKLQDVNSAGYLSLIMGDLNVAEERFEQAVRQSNSDLVVSSEYQALPLYNLAICRLLRRDLPSAVATLELAEQALTRLEKADAELACLLVPCIQDGHAVITQIKHPDLGETVRSTLDLLTSTGEVPYERLFGRSL